MEELFEATLERYARLHESKAGTEKKRGGSGSRVDREKEGFLVVPPSSQCAKEAIQNNLSKNNQRLSWLCGRFNGRLTVEV